MPGSTLTTLLSMQPEVYQNFDHEVDFLRQYFGNLGDGGNSHVLGDPSCGLQWHVYVADAEPTVHKPTAAPAVYSLEVCMTELCQEKAVQFFRGQHFISAQHTSTSSGIQALLPSANIDDYVFEPCGYSMNGMEGAGFSTIHITPEDGFSYASFEVSNYATQDLDINQLVTALVQVFNPGKLTVALTVDTNLPCCIWGESVQTPDSYSCHASCKQSFQCGGRTSFYSMVKQTKAPHMGSTSEPVSPMTVIGHPHDALVPHMGSVQGPVSPMTVIEHPHSALPPQTGTVQEPVSPMTMIERPPSAMSMSCHSDFDRFSNMDATEEARPRDNNTTPGDATASPPDPTDSNRMSVMSVLHCYNATMLDVGSDAAYDAFINKVRFTALLL